MDTSRWLAQLKVGDVVMRLLGGQVPCLLKITAISHDLVECGPWRFSRLNGAEIDEELGLPAGVYASYIRKPTEAELVLYRL